MTLKAPHGRLEQDLMIIATDSLNQYRYQVGTLADLIDILDRVTDLEKVVAQLDPETLDRLRRAVDRSNL